MATTVHYTKAIAFITSHGHFAALSLDGIVATSEVNHDDPRCAGFDDGDVWFEETTVFHVDTQGNVEAREVRAWLGY